MQKEYIERTALKADLQESYEGLKNIYKVLKHDEERRICEAQLAVIIEAILRVKDAPAADVVEVVHGRWEYVTRRYEAWTHRCSECGEIMTTQIGRQANYCHNCGAKMDKEDKDT